MVRVNNKPQHLVFGWHFGHLLSKYRDLAVETLEQPCPMRVLPFKLPQEQGNWRTA